MKKILISLSVIAAVAAIAFGATTAFFSDTEQSNGNTFTAGTLDLIFQSDDGQGVFADVNGNPLFDEKLNLLLGDMKPGDEGEKTIKLWVNDNPSCGFVNIDLKGDNDNSCNKPEEIAEPGCKADDLGELNDQVQFMIFSDSDCDNKFEIRDSSVLTSGTLTEDKKYAIGELPIKDGQCYGIAYCFGVPSQGTPDQDGHVPMVCDGSNIGNSAQSDSFSGDIVISVTQKRNQYDNGCPTGDVTNI